MPSVLSNASEAIGWFVAVVVSSLRDLGHTWSSATGRERFRLAESSVWPPASAVLLLMLDWPGWFWLLPVALLVRWLSDVGDIAQVVAWRAKTARILERQPTGAPRVANLRCSEGRTHRFVYGVHGWEEAGPSTENYPEAEPSLST